MKARKETKAPASVEAGAFCELRYPLPLPGYTGGDKESQKILKELSDRQ